jgi:RNA-directed DNA polymerase
MRRESHVRFCEGPGVKIPRATRLVMGFQREQDARAMHKALAERLATFGLELHPDKTRVLRFGRFAHRKARLDGRTRPETFDFLGFTHILARGSNGWGELIRRTSTKKRNAKLASLRRQMRERRHDPPREQHAWLSSVLRGHYGYYGVSNNYPALASFQYHVRRDWHRSLQQRSQRAHWTRVRREAFEARFVLPPPRITHPYPKQRFAGP